MEKVLDQKVLGVKMAKADVPQSHALGAALVAPGLEVALPEPCRGTPSMLGMAPSRDLGHLWWVGAAPHTAVSQQCLVFMGTPGATPPASHSDQHQACHIHIPVSLHLSCSKDLKCREGWWERASLTKGKKGKQTEETALATQQASPLEKEHVTFLAEN